jgi:glycosyltransferase involved in cell wall biosynthesis
MLVSAIMPTRGRPQLSRAAIDCFLLQDYEDRELLILDDEDAPSFPFTVFYDCSRIRYARSRRATIGAKLEWLSQEARGDVIIRFDSDDWSASNRISSQVAQLKETGKGLTGYHSLLFWDAQKKEGYRWKGHAPFCCGTSMCYTKDWWTSHHWPEYAIINGQKRVEGTDNVLVRQAISDHSIDSVDGVQMCVARAHGSNTSSARTIEHNGWPKVPASEFPNEFLEVTCV